MKVLFHIDQSENWTMLLNDLTHLLQYGAQNHCAAEVEVLANGNAVQELQTPRAMAAGLYEQLSSLAGRARFCACSNALHHFGIPPASLVAQVQVVPAGVVELVRRQQEGYAYIKP